MDIIRLVDHDELKEVHERLQLCGAKIDRLIDHGMTKSVYFRDPDGIRVECFFNTTDTPEQGLAVMRDPAIRATDFEFEESS